MTVKRRHDMGAGGYCVRPKCDEKTLHHSGVPCQEERCPNCGAKLLREGSHHHQLLQHKAGRKTEKRGFRIARLTTTKGNRKLSKGEIYAIPRTKQ